MCSCLPQFVGTPPACRPECILSSECSTDKACVNQKCVSPCLNSPCGQNADCRVRNHSPICSCNKDFTGDAFTKCFLLPRELKYILLQRQSLIKILYKLATPVEIQREDIRDPCSPSPCGPNSECRNKNGLASCSCLPTFIGQPPNCRPECSINSECPSDQACINQKCRDPCPGACGLNTYCRIINHTPTCACSDGFVGNPFISCSPKLLPRKTSMLYLGEFSYNNSCSIAPSPILPINPCTPSPCGVNAVCTEGECSCLKEYQGDPYDECRPECILNSDCPRNRTCIRNKCADPCPGTCAINAICEVYNHIPMCHCPKLMTGNAFFECHAIQCK